MQNFIFFLMCFDERSIIFTDIKDRLAITPIVYLPAHMAAHKIIIYTKPINPIVVKKTMNPIYNAVNF